VRSSGLPRTLEPWSVREGEKVEDVIGKSFAISTVAFSALVSFTMEDRDIRDFTLETAEVERCERNRTCLSCAL
jgi:hypothetical protein